MRLIDADALIAEMHNVILEDGEDRRTFYEVIERQPTIEPERTSVSEWQKDFREYMGMLNIPRDDYNGIMEYINEVPSAQPEQHGIGYSECASAMLKMWIDNVLTDGEYNRIMDKLNAHWAERREE